MTRFMAQIPGRPTQVGSALQTQSPTIAETTHSHHMKLPRVLNLQPLAWKEREETQTPMRRTHSWLPSFLNVPVHCNIWYPHVNGRRQQDRTKMSLGPPVPK